MDEVQLLSLLFIREPLLYTSYLKRHLRNGKVSVSHVVNGFVAVKEAFDILGSHEAASKVYSTPVHDRLEGKSITISMLEKYKGKISKLSSYTTGGDQIERGH